MKLKTLFAVLVLTISSFASDIPEAKPHPELYTIQFVLAELPSTFSLDQEIPMDRKKILARIQDSEPKYVTLATIYTLPNIEFSDEAGMVKGKLDSVSDTIHILKLKVPDYPTINSLTIDAKSSDWFTCFLGGKIVDGKQKPGCFLIKAYHPIK